MPVNNTNQDSDSHFKLSPKPKTSLEIELAGIVYQNLYGDLYELTEKLERIKTDIANNVTFDTENLATIAIQKSLNKQRVLIMFLVALGILQTIMIFVLYTKII